MTWPAGFAIHERAVTPELVEAVRGLPTTIVSDCLGRSVGAVGLEPFHGDRSLVLCGVALTVRVRPGDNLMIHKALTLAQHGDVVVVERTRLAEEDEQQRHHRASRTDPSLRARDDERVAAMLRAKGCPV